VYGLPIRFLPLMKYWRKILTEDCVASWTTTVSQLSRYDELLWRLNSC